METKYPDLIDRIRELQAWIDLNTDWSRSDDIRRTAVRNLERAGVSRSVSMKITGHKTEAVYRRYSIADQLSLEEGLEKLAVFRAAQLLHNDAKA